MFILYKIILFAILLEAAYSKLPKYQEKCAEYAELVESFEEDPSSFRSSQEEEEIDQCSYVAIHGGDDAAAKEFPFMALIGYGPGTNIRWRCGGSLISENFILSAAHCSDTSEGRARWARLGDLDISSTTDDADTKVVSIKERIVHRGYTAGKLYNDIALFKLSQIVSFNEYISPICLYGGPHVDDQNSMVTGWGATERAYFSPILQKAEVKIVTDCECIATYNTGQTMLSSGINTTNMVCAKGNHFEDTCRGDSGGPLFISINHFHYFMKSQVGVTSFGKITCDSVGVYTRVSNFIPWIESIVWPN